MFQKFEKKKNKETQPFTTHQKHLLQSTVDSTMTYCDLCPPYYHLQSRLWHMTPASVHVPPDVYEQFMMELSLP